MSNKSEKPDQVPEEEPKKVNPRRRAKRFFVGTSVLVLLLLAGLAGYAFAYAQRILPRTTVAGVAVGGLTKTEALAVVNARNQSFGNANVSLTYELKSWSVKPQAMGLQYNPSDAITQAYAIGRGGSPIRQIGELILAPFKAHSVDETTNGFSSSGLTYLHDTVLKGIEQPAAETALSLVPGHVTVTGGTAGHKLNQDQLEADLANALNQGSSQSIAVKMTAFQPQITAAQAETARTQADAILSSAWQINAGGQVFTIDPKDMAGWITTAIAKDPSGNATGMTVGISDDAVTKYLTDLTAKVSKSPTNATLQAVNGVVSVAKDGVEGATVDIPQSEAVVKSALLAANPGSSGRTISVVAQTVEPTIQASTLQSLGLTALIGTGTTDFSGSPSNRVANITVGEQKITGQVVKDGAEFSTVSALGVIDEAHGYVQGLVIVNGQTLPADGGGLCQVSTTLFRSVLNAGLPVTARSPHSYEVSYYQRGIGPGLDATIYDPKPDFKWKNDTGHDIYVQGIMKGTTLTFELYGTSDGRTAAIDGPHTLSTTQPSGNPIYVNTDTLPVGKTELIDPAIPGAKTTATYTVTRDGQVINQQTFNSSYQAMPAQYLVGTKAS